MSYQREIPEWAARAGRDADTGAHRGVRVQPVPDGLEVPDQLGPPVCQTRGIWHALLLRCSRAKMNDLLGWGCMVKTVCELRNFCSASTTGQGQPAARRAVV
eukprot:gene13780-biopygen20064